MDIFARIECYRPDYTNSDSKIVAFILKNPQVVEELTVSRIARDIGTSKSAVMRLCQKLRYSGYSEFRYDMIRALHGGEAQQRDKTLLETNTKLYASGVEEMGRIPEKDILDIVEMIHNAPVVRSMGLLNSSLPALKIYYDFTALGKNVVAFTDPVMPGTASSLRGSDLILYFSTLGEAVSSGVNDFLDQARELGCEVVLITCNAKPQIAKYVSRIVLLPTLKLANGTTMDARVMMLVLVNILAEYYKMKM